jgi:MarR family transcriptional regulator, 2-MHQ and catechol-resistance regulon repressor
MTAKEEEALAMEALERDGRSAMVVPACPSVVNDERITLMGLLVESHARLTRVLGDELEEACGLPLTWYDVMIRLGRSPEGHLTMSQLAGEVSLTSGGITRLVDRMVEAGYLERSGCPTDRRSVYVGLTPSGSRKLEEATAEHLRGLDRHLLAPLEEADRESLAAVLRKLRDAQGCPN